MDYIDQKTWDANYAHTDFAVAGQSKDYIIDLINEYIKPTSEMACFELGCFPAAYLSYFASCGCTISGIDLTPRTATDLLPWMQSRGFSIGKIISGDAFSYINTTEDRYDVVTSYGFIEHFDDYCRVILDHGKILKKHGLLLITAPNFKGTIQHFLHNWLDRPNLKRHNLAAMQPDVWKQTLEEAGYTVLYSGFFGGFEFLYEKTNRPGWQRCALSAVRLAQRLGRRFPIPNNPLYAAYCGIVARKN